VWNNSFELQSAFLTENLQKKRPATAVIGVVDESSSVQPQVEKTKSPAVAVDELFHWLDDIGENGHLSSTRIPEPSVSTTNQGDNNDYSKALQDSSTDSSKSVTSELPQPDNEETWADLDNSIPQMPTDTKSTFWGSSSTSDDSEEDDVEDFPFLTSEQESQSHPDNPDSSKPSSLVVDKEVSGNDLLSGNDNAKPSTSTADKAKKKHK